MNAICGGDERGAMHTARADENASADLRGHTRPCWSASLAHRMQVCIFQMVWVNVNKGKLRMHIYRHSLVRQSVHLQYVVDKSEHCFATIAIGSV